ncbi:uncharacterized protein EI90DRAFT_3212074 [Cantharellus anzutake]|uniref:uncharacterized protein n=1 Tax=Cantharellus anzutake TaxID=1750568 RepID=UPI00190884C2|nr:uncharacterized protein EI90DRAFT_3212074 [Cantharellus anzutake]KAF8309702.1 hypothetical protein EI90DRAFT_3212074 [Cantharellus anzutake]
MPILLKKRQHGHKSLGSSTINYRQRSREAHGWMWGWKSTGGNSSSTGMHPSIMMSFRSLPMGIRERLKEVGPHQDKKGTFVMFKQASYLWLVAIVHYPIMHGCLFMHSEPKETPANLDQVWSLANKECTEGTARMEIHVPLGKARNTLRGITRECIEECTISVPARQWWLFKLLTACACHQLIEAQRNATPKSRVQPYALELTAALLWCINMLNSRPATGSSENALMCASLPVTNNFLHPDVLDGCDRNPHRDQAEGEQCHPFAPGNVLWFRDISYGGPSNHGRIAPSFRAHTTLGLVRWWPLDEDHFNHLLGYSVEEIKTLLSATLYTVVRAPFRLPRPHHTEAPPVLEPEHELPANLHVKLKKHHIKHLRTAYSVEDHHSVPQLVQGTTSIIYTKSLHQIIHYFYSNILQTIPVPQTPSSDLFYHITSNGNHQECSANTIRTGDRGGHIQFKDGGKGWKRHPFHVSWWEFIIKFDCTGGNRIREKIWETVYSKLVWVPYSELPQMWFTTANPQSSDTFPADRAGTRLPVLILNPLVDDKAMWDGNLIRRGVWKSPILQDEGTED